MTSDIKIPFKDWETERRKYDVSQYHVSMDGIKQVVTLKLLNDSSR